MKLNIGKSNPALAEKVVENVEQKPVAPARPGGILAGLLAKKQETAPETPAVAENSSPVSGGTADKPKTSGLVLGKPKPASSGPTVSPAGIVSGPEVSEVKEFSDPQMQAAHEALQVFKEAFSGDGDVAYALRETMMALRESPQYCDILAEEEIGMMVETLRRSYGQAIERKGTKRSKRTEKAGMAEEFGQLLSDLGGFEI
jgi:hypothetical protein